MDVKNKLIQSCEAYIQQRKEVVLKAMKGLKEDLENESKSSAGDKYETGREMINIEWNKLSRQLRAYENHENTLDRVRNQSTSKKVVLGSVVKTNAAHYFIAIPAGKIEISKELFYAIGSQAPVAKEMLGKETGEDFQINGKRFKITAIL